MSSKKQIKRNENLLKEEQPASPDPTVSELKEQMKQLQMEVDILKETLNVLKKDPGINITELKNREKAVIIDAVKERYSLPVLLRHFKIAKSSYYYQEKAMKRADKYNELRNNVKSIFQENRYNSCVSDTEM